MGRKLPEKEIILKVPPEKNPLKLVGKLLVEFLKN